jgi:hypothetical protein
MFDVYKLIFICLFLALNLKAQDKNSSSEKNDQFLLEENSSTFESTRIINGHSPDVLEKNILQMKIDHRFGSVTGGIQSLYGLDNSSDIRIGFDYGLSDKILLGIGRSKGTGSPYRSLLDGFAKIKLKDQFKNKIPLTISALLGMSYTYMNPSSDISEVNNFPNWQHRFAYTSQLLFGYKLANRLSLALMPTLVHRNYVAADDVNSLFSLGGAISIKASNSVSFQLEYYQTFQKEIYRTLYQNALSLGMQYCTYGHTFSVILSNCAGLGETQFIPYTSDNWLKGQFRLGFCIERNFKLSNK